MLFLKIFKIELQTKQKLHGFIDAKQKFYCFFYTTRVYAQLTQGGV